MRLITSNVAHYERLLLRQMTHMKWESPPPITVSFAELRKWHLKLAPCQSSHFYVFNFFHYLLVDEARSLRASATVQPGSCSYRLCPNHGACCLRLAVRHVRQRDLAGIKYFCRPQWQTAGYPRLGKK